MLRFQQPLAKKNARPSNHDGLLFEWLDAGRTDVTIMAPVPSSQSVGAPTFMSRVLLSVWPRTPG